VGRVRRFLRWAIVGPPLATLLACGVIAGRMSPTAPGVALACFEAAAGLCLLKAGSWVAASHERFGRQERLALFVVLGTIGLGWIGARQWVAERRFDDLVARQDHQLKLTVEQLSTQILAFVAERERHAPPPPRPATWARDEDAFLSYETDTVREFNAAFGAQVRAAHDVLGLLGIVDRDLDGFYRRPANDFQMRIVAARLATCVAKLP
jgi:hypothetical protein